MLAYLAWDIAEEDLRKHHQPNCKLDMIKPISMPYKQEGLSLFRWSGWDGSKIGSVNTIVHRDGKLKGYNTDGIGFFRGLPPLS